MLVLMSLRRRGGAGGEGCALTSGLWRNHRNQRSARSTCAHPSRCTQASQLAAAEQYEANLVTSLFQGAAGDALENQLEGEVEGIKPRLEQVGF